MLAILKPHPHRGDTVAAGVVVLALFTLVTVLRFAGAWGDAPRFVLAAAVAALVIAMAVLADSGDPVPRPYESVLFVASFGLLVLALVELAELLGAEDAGDGTAVWVTAILLVYAAWLARRRTSAIMALLAALSGVTLFLAFVQWAFDPDGPQTYRWLLLLSALVLTAMAVHQRDADRRRAVAFADVAGLSIIGLGYTLALAGVFVISGEETSGRPSVGWELVLFAFGVGLIAYGCVDRERVPAFLGTAVLGIFGLLASRSEDATLIGWPIVLLVLAGGLLAIGLRPRRDLPPEPEVPNP